MILMYHRLGIEQGFNTLPIRFFNDHIRFLKDNFHLLSLDEYLLHWHKRTLSSKSVCISFDDGYVTTIEHLLDHHAQLPAIMYVPVNFIGKQNTWDKGYAYKIASQDMLQQLISSTQTSIGSHGLTHRRLAKLSEDSIRAEIMDSKLLLEEMFAINIQHFSYPFGQKKDLSFLAPKFLNEAGYQSAVTTLYGDNRKVVSPFHLQRIEIEQDDSLEKLKNKLSGWKFIYRSWKQYLKNHM